MDASLLRTFGLVASNTVEATKDGEQQDDLAIFRLLMVAAQQVDNQPDKG